LQAQQLEPRRWTHLPEGARFIGLGYVRTEGDILFDPALRIENAEVNMNSLGVGYIRSFALWGRSARVDLNVPYFDARWHGLLDGEERSVQREGFGDPRVRLSVLLHGAPALSGEAFSSYRASNPVTTQVGAGLSLTLPLGEYNREFLLNLGNNRFVLRPELGVVHNHDKWSFELTGSLRLFETNKEFWPGDSRRKQDPLFLLQGHVVHTFRPGLWTSLSGGYGFGGESTVNGLAKDDENDNFFWALTIGMPLGQSQGLKLAYAGVRTNNLVGIDSENLVLAWSFMF
jgi:hypothetical protein